MQDYVTKTIFGKKLFGKKFGTWVWCLHCQRVYQVGQFRRQSDGQLLCPYPDCNGDVFMDAWDWKRFRKEAHPEFPEIPEEDTVYPLYT